MPHIVIAGAGIGGLTAALALARTGVTVSLFERAGALAEVGAGIQLSPNATAVLQALDLLDDLRAIAVEPDEVAIRRGRDGALLARIPFGAAAVRRYGFPFLLASRAGLQAVLAARVRRDPAISLHFGREVGSYRAEERGVRLAFAGDHPPQRVDGLVAADGIRSTVMRHLAGQRRGGIEAAGRTAWRSLVDRGAVPPDARLPQSNLWLGRRAHLVHYPVDGGRLVNIVAIVDEPADTAGSGLWSRPADGASLQRRFAAWAEPARTLIAAGSEWRTWPLFDRAPLPRWSDGAVTLLGDAAHPMLPFLAQGAAQAIEDAAALATCVAETPGDLPAAFLAYESLRRPRTARVQMESRRQATVYHLAPPAATARDVVLRLLGPDRLAARYDWLYAGPRAASRR